MRLISAVIAIEVVLFTIAATAQQATPAAVPTSLPPVPGKVFTITEQPGAHSEPTIAVNARNPQQAFAAYQAHAIVVYTQDGGASWKTATGTASTDYAISGDVASTYDKKGAAILCYISFDKLGTMNYWAQGATRNGIFIRRSADGGATWDKQDHAVIAQPTKPGIPFEDKPGIAADNTDSPYAGNLYVGWTEFRLDESVILFSRSTDGGVTWSTPIEISTHHGLPRDDNGDVEGFQAAVGADGTVYAVWADGNSLAFTTSHDGGKTFEKSRSVIDTAPLYFDVQDLVRANGFPQLGIDTHHGERGRLYVTWSDYRSGDIGVYASTSDDGGATWGKAARVSSNPPHDGTDQFFQWLSVDPVTGVPNVIFYDRRGDARNRNTTVTLARSTDGGETWTNYAWTREPFVSSRLQFLGDYIGVAALNNKVYGTWTEVAPAEPPKDKSAPPQRGFRPETVVKVGVAEFGAGK